MANKLFCNRFLTIPSSDKSHASSFSTFISFNSYLYQHAYRSGRATMYSYLTLLIFLVLVEDPNLAKLLCDGSGPVRLCRQRPPYLPTPKTDRSYAASIMDLLTDATNHNLRKRLDTSFYVLNLTVLTKLLSYLAKSRTKLAHHWSELWRSLLSFVRFLTTYPDDMKALPRTTELVQALVVSRHPPQSFPQDSGRDMASRSSSLVSLFIISKTIWAEIAVAFFAGCPMPRAY